jgi:hypothetical protein
MRTKLPLYCALAALFWLVVGALSPVLACIDSIHLKIVPVQCNGLRNGLLRVTEVFGSNAPYLYSLDGSSYSTNPEFDRLWAGDYQVFVKDKDGCVHSKMVVLPEPEPLLVRLTATDSTVNAGDYVQIKAVVSPKDAKLGLLDWRPDGLFAQDDTLFQWVRLMQDTQIVIEINDKNYCVARDIKRFYVDETRVYAPNVFRPNSDQNAWFTLFAGEGLDRIKLLTIQGRNGEQVFQRTDMPPNDPLSGWNGRYNGKYVQAGVYLWAAELALFDGRVVRKHGTISVVY